MPRDIPSHAETHAALERAASLLKRQIREAREILATVRHAQVHILGIQVETIPPHGPEGGRSDTTETEASSPLEAARDNDDA